MKLISPALLTFDEYCKIINKSEKMHPDDAYHTTLKNFEHYKPSDYPILINNIEINGLMFTIKKREEKNKYVQVDSNGNIIRGKNGNEVFYYTDEQVLELGKPLYNHEYVAICENKIVAMVQDEWGCVLVRVAEEFKGFGLGPLLVKIERKESPYKSSGGFTSAGYKNIMKVYVQIVSEFLTSGLYLKLVKQHEITPERVKEILESCKKLKSFINKNPKQKFDFSDNPSDWLLYYKDSCFILYNKKLKDVIENASDYFVDRYIKGFAWISGGINYDNQLRRFAGDTDEIKKVLMLCATKLMNMENRGLMIEGHELQYVDTDFCEVEDISYGDWKYEITFKKDITKKLNIPFSLDITKEREFRKSFDKYDEFKNRLIELAEGKWD